LPLLFLNGDLHYASVSTGILAKQIVYVNRFSLFWNFAQQKSDGSRRN
jgi:hypothetical protein